MVDEIEVKIEELIKEVYPIWASGEVGKQPERLRDHNLMVIYLKNSYDHIRSFEQSGFGCEVFFHPNPIFHIIQGGYLQYGDIGIDKEGAKKLLESITDNVNEQRSEQYKFNVRKVIEIEKRIFQLTE